MLSRQEAERLANQVLDAERGPRKPPVRRRAWFMGMWRGVCPDLRLLDGAPANVLVADAAKLIGRSPAFRISSLIPAVVAPALVNQGASALWALPAILLGPMVYVWMMRREIERRLPEALAASIDMGEV